MKCLILFHSKYGQTEKISRRIAAVFEAKLNSVDLCAIGKTLPPKAISFYDLVVMGAPIYASKHSKMLERFIKSNFTDLNARVTGFFSVSLSAAGDASQRDDATRCMEKYLAKLRWEPTHRQILAGGLPYRKYNWFTRWFMKRIVVKAGGDTDTQKDFEYTNWENVERLAQQMLDLAEQKEPI